MKLPPLCQELGMTFPLFAFTRSPEVAIAVTEAGGMGVQAAIGFTTEELKRCLDTIASRVGDKPFGLDVVMPSGFVMPDGTEGEGGMASAVDYHAMLPKEHVEFLNGLLARHGVAPLPEGSSSALAMHEWTDKVSRAQVELGLSYPIRLIANALGTPPPDIIAQCHQKGVKVAALVGSKRHALKQRAQGVDIVIAQGTEAGGHCGDIAAMVLVPEVVDAIAPAPVVAAGGIGSGRQLAAAIALGAQGGWAGSLWLTTEEGQIDKNLTQKLLAASSSDTVRSRALSGKPARQLRSPWTEAWEAPENPKPLPMPLQFLLTAEAIARIHRHAAATGDATLMPSAIGQIVGRMNTVRPVREVLAELKAEFEVTCARMGA